MRGVFITVFCFAFFAVYAVEISEEEREREVLKEGVLMWLAAVEAGEEDRAILLASDILEREAPSPVNPDYLGLFKKNNINPAYLKADFNSYDFQLWEHAFFFHETAREIAAQAEDDYAVIRALFDEVYNRLERGKFPIEKIPWPYNVWRFEQGKCDRQAWVLCELAYQLGYETQIVYLRNPETLVSPHTIAEIRKEGMVWTADPYAGRLLPGVSIRDIAEDATLAASIWPDNKRYQEAVTAPAFWLPAYPQDYCARNQMLRHEVGKIPGGDSPRFGEPPAARLKNYLDLVNNRDGDFEYNFWFFPVRVFALQLLLEHKGETRE